MENTIGIVHPAQTNLATAEISQNCKVSRNLPSRSTFTVKDKAIAYGFL